MAAWPPLVLPTTIVVGPLSEPVTETIPAVTVTGPVKVLFAGRTRAPLPTLVRPPLLLAPRGLAKVKVGWV